MSVSDRAVDLPGGWPTGDELERAAAGRGLVILPERVDGDGETLTAFLSPDAQGLRVKGRQAGLTPLILRPEGARVAPYSWATPVWVLPVVAAIGSSTVARIVADFVRDRIDRARRDRVALPIVRYREAVIDDRRVSVREIEGPAEEVERLLRERPPIG